MTDDLGAENDEFNLARLANGEEGALLVPRQRFQVGRLGNGIVAATLALALEDERTCFAFSRDDALRLADELKRAADDAFSVEKDRGLERGR
jgi:hypothetical protein